MISYHKYKILADNISTLKDVSLDITNNSYMVDDETKVIDFDRVKEMYSYKLGSNASPLCSSDALSQTKESHLLIEFKNGKVNTNDIKYKIIASILLFCSITGKNLDYTQDNMEFILVYNDSRYPNDGISYRRYISTTVNGLANKEFIGFGIGEYYKIFFKDAHTYSISQFKRFANNIVAV